MKPWDDMKVAVAAASGFTIPDIASFFTTMGPVWDGLAVLGKVGVAIATIFYIFKKTRAILPRKRK